MNPKELSPYSLIRLSRMGLYDLPHRFSRETKKQILRKLMAKQVTYDSMGRVIEPPVTPGFEEDRPLFFPSNISFSDGERSPHSLQSSPGPFDNMNLNETDWDSGRTFSPIPFDLPEERLSDLSSPLQSFRFRSPAFRASTPVPPKIPPYMESKGVQPSPKFIAQADFCKDNHWKMLAFEFLYTEIIGMLESHGVDLDQRIKYSPTVLSEMLWSLLSKLVQEKLQLENEALNQSSIYDFGGKIENLNRSVLSQLYETEKQLLRQRRVNVKERHKVVDYKTRLQTAMANFAFPVQKENEQKALAQLAAAQETIGLLNVELQIKRERNSQLEEQVLSLSHRIAEIQARCARDLTEAAQISILGEEAVEAAVTSYMERATQMSPQPLSPSEWQVIAADAVKHLEHHFDLNARTIQRLENEMIVQNKTLNAMEAERLKMKEKIYDLDVTLRQQRHMIQLYEEDLEPAGREIREWIEYAARKGGPPADPTWTPYVPNPYEDFVPEGFSSPLPADQAFRELPLAKRRIFTLRSPEPVYTSTMRSPMQHISRSRLMASPPAASFTLPTSPVVVATASPQYATAASVQVPSPAYAIASPRYAAAAPVQVASSGGYAIASTPVQVASPGGYAIASTPVRVASPGGYAIATSPIQVASSPAGLSSYGGSFLEDESLPSGLSGFSDSPGVVMSPLSPYHPINMSGIPSIFSPIEAEDYAGPVVPAWGTGGPFTPPSDGSVSQSVLLHSPFRAAPVQLDVSVNPRPLEQTTSGERVVCDISMNMEDLAARR